MRLKARRPLLSIRVLERTSDLLMTELQEKTIDVVIGRFTDETQHNSFDFRPIAATPMCLVVNPRHPLLSAQDLALTCHAHPTYSEAVREAALACGDGAIHA